MIYDFSSTTQPAQLNVQYPSATSCLTIACAISCSTLPKLYVSVLYELNDVYIQETDSWII